MSSYPSRWWHVAFDGSNIRDTICSLCSQNLAHCWRYWYSGHWAHVWRWRKHEALAWCVGSIQREVSYYSWHLPWTGKPASANQIALLTVCDRWVFLLVCQIILQLQINAERLDFAMLSVQCRDGAKHHHFWSDEMLKNLFMQLIVNAAMHPRLNVVTIEQSGYYGGLQWRHTVWSSLSGEGKSGWVLSTRNNIMWQGWTAWSPFEPCVPHYSNYLCPFDQGPCRF